MLWATVSSQSCFCWLYRASPSLAAENTISLILVLAIWWCPCVESSLVLLEESVCYDQCVLLAKLYEPLPWFILYSKVKFACYSRCFLTSYFCIQAPIMKRTSFLGVSSRSSCRPSRTIQLQLLQHYWLGHRLGLLWYWMICLGNEQRSFCHFWNCIQILHFRLLLTMRATPFLLRIEPTNLCAWCVLSTSVWFPHTFTSTGYENLLNFLSLW